MAGEAQRRRSRKHRGEDQPAARAVRARGRRHPEPVRARVRRGQARGAGDDGRRANPRVAGQIRGGVASRSSQATGGWSARGGERGATGPRRHGRQRGQEAGDPVEDRSRRGGARIPQRGQAPRVFAHPLPVPDAGRVVDGGAFSARRPRRRPRRSTRRHRLHVAHARRGRGEPRARGGGGEARGSLRRVRRVRAKPGRG